MWSDDAAKNAALWTETNREHTDDSAPVNWALDEISWGIWAIDESELNVLPDVDGLDVVELGCGTAYFSAWLAKRGARPVGVDITPAQLATARRLMEGDRHRVSARRGRRCRHRAAVGELRSRRLGVRRVDLGRPVPLDPGSCTAAPAERPARVPAQLDTRDPLLAGRGAGERDAPAPAVRHAPFRVAGGRRRVPSAAR